MTTSLQASSPRNPFTRFPCGSRGLDELAGEQGCCGLCGLLDAADVVPRLEGASPLGAVVGCGHAVAGPEEEVVDRVVGGQETLSLSGRLEPLHLAFPSSCWLVRVLCPVVEPLVLAVLDARHDLLLRRAIRFQLIRDHDAGSPALPLQQLAQQPLGRLLVPPMALAKAPRRLWTSTSSTTPC